MVGQTIGKYRIGDRLGRGGMGTVYRAVDEILHREVAIKALNAGLNDPGIGRRFRAEAVAVARLNHPGIAMIYELVEHEGQWMMVIEYVRGETLDSLVLRSGQLGSTQAAELTIQVLSALAHAHSMGVVHRDLKPQNIMITETGTTKVMDFGIARVAGTEHLTSAGFLMGTPAYMAPEQVMGGEVDNRTDLYSMGVVLYYLLTATLPFKGDTPMAMVQSRVRDLPTPIRAIRQDLPAWISLVLERALERAADRRYQSADEMRDALRRGLSGLPITAAAPMLTPPGLSPADYDPAAPTIVVRPTGSNRLTPASPTPQTGSIQSVVPSLTPSLPVPSPAPSLAVPSVTPSPRVDSPAPSLPPPAPQAAEPSVAAAPKTPSKKVSTLTIAAIAAGAVVLLIAGVLVVRGLRNTPPTVPAETRPATPPPATVGTTPPVEPSASTPDPTAATRPDPQPPPTGGAPPPTAAAVPAAPPPAGTTGARGAPGVGTKAGTTTGAAAGSGTGPGPGASPRAGAAGPPPAGTPSATPTGTAPAGPGRSARGTSIAPPAVTGTPTDTVLKIDIKYLEVAGRTGIERDASIYMGGGMISVISRTGTTIAAVQYRDLASATHTHAKDPRWDTALPGPPSNLDVPGGVFRPEKHWLALQSKSQYVVLRLEDGNWRHVVETLEARTGIRVALASR